MTAFEFSLAGEALLADISGALYWPAQETLAVADLHLEKGSSFARDGQLLPPYDSRATLGRLAETIELHRPARIICLGDSFHDMAAPDRLGGDERGMLTAMAEGREWLWLAGNHDPGPALDELRAGPLVFRHEAQEGAEPGEISGHFHPKARLGVRGRGVGGRCFATDGARLILPAFGAYAGGLDVTNEAIAGLLASPFQVLVVGRAKLHALSSAQLRTPTAGERRSSR